MQKVTHHTFKNIGGKDHHYIDGELAFVDGRPQPRFEGTESKWRRKSDEEMNQE